MNSRERFESDDKLWATLPHVSDTKSKFDMFWKVNFKFNCLIWLRNFLLREVEYLHGQELRFVALDLSAKFCSERKALTKNSSPIAYVTVIMR